MRKEVGSSWEDQGRQTHGWFGNGTSGTTAASTVPPPDEKEVAKQAARLALTRLPRRMRTDFEEFTGQDGGERMLEAMAIWADAAGMSPAAFSRTVVGPGVSKEGAAALQAMGQSLSDAGADPAAASAAGEHLATALLTMRPSSFSYDLCYAQDQAVYAAANGQVPDRPVPPSPPQAPQAQPPLPTITVRPDGSKLPKDVPTIVAILSVMAAELRAAAFAEAALVLLAALPATVLAALVLYLMTRRVAAPVDPSLIPPFVPPEQHGLVPPAPAEKPREGGFTAAPTPVKPGEGGTTPAPPLPNKEEGPAPAPAMPIVTPKIKPEERAKQKKVLKGLNLPVKGPYPFVPPKTGVQAIHCLAGVRRAI